jgi:Cu/Ag efflux protein CusF
MKLFHLVMAAALSTAFGVDAQTAPAAGADRSAQLAEAPAADGQVRKVDKEQGKLTLRHGPIANLDMPGMTMVFKVADPKMLDGLKPGDKVKFAAERVDGAITVTAIEAAR